MYAYMFYTYFVRFIPRFLKVHVVVMNEIHIFNQLLLTYRDVILLKFLFRILQFCSTRISSSVPCTYIF